MAMIPVRRPYGAGPGPLASAAGGPAMPGMGAAVPQLGRTNAMPPMGGAPGGGGVPPMPGPPQVPVPPPAMPGMGMGDPGGGPMAPQNIGSMLQPSQQPPGQQGQGQPGAPPPGPGTPLPPWGEDQFGGADGGGTNVGGGMGKESQIPMVMLKLMQHLGHI